MTTLLRNLVVAYVLEVAVVVTVAAASVFITYSGAKFILAPEPFVLGASLGLLVTTALGFKLSMVRKREFRPPLERLNFPQVLVFSSAVSMSWYGFNFLIGVSVLSETYLIFCLLFGVATALSAQLKLGFVSVFEEQAFAATNTSPDDLIGTGRGKKAILSLESYRNKVVLVTGAGGSIGSEICRQIATCNPAKLICLDISEYGLFAIGSEFSDKWDDVPVELVLGSVSDRKLLDQIFQDNDVDIVFHAAAYKHVPIVERNPRIGIENNVFGTQTLAQAANGKAGKVIFISTDKAIRPAGVMGATKRLAEIILQDIASRPSSTVFSTVRFGNVIGSSGSVVPVFDAQISRGGPVTITHPDMARFFMTSTEAVALVLNAGTVARGGEIFVLDMGPPVSINRLAKDMIEAKGLSVKTSDNPHGDIEIVVSGVRPGEKMVEEISFSGELKPTDVAKIMISEQVVPSEIEVAKALRDLRNAIIADNYDAAVELLFEAVGEVGPRQEALYLHAAKLTKTDA